jgi:hypothetical protein
MRSLVRDILLCLSVPALAGCVEPGCTLSIEPGVEVEVRDRLTEEYLATTPRGVAREGPYEDSLQIWSVTADVPPRVFSLAGATERGGTYSVHLEAEGYESWDTAGVRVSEGDCGVRTERFTADLQPTP